MDRLPSNFSPGPRAGPPPASLLLRFGSGAQFSGPTVSATAGLNNIPSADQNGPPPLMPQKTREDSRPHGVIGRGNRKRSLTEPTANPRWPPNSQQCWPNRGYSSQRPPWSNSWFNNRSRRGIMSPYPSFHNASNYNYAAPHPMPPSLSYVNVPPHCTEPSLGSFNHQGYSTINPTFNVNFNAAKDHRSSTYNNSNISWRPLPSPYAECPSYYGHPEYQSYNRHLLKTEPRCPYSMNGSQRDTSWRTPSASSSTTFSEDLPPLHRHRSTNLETNLAHDGYCDMGNLHGSIGCGTGFRTPVVEEGVYSNSSFAEVNRAPSDEEKSKIDQTNSRVSMLQPTGSHLYDGYLDPASSTGDQFGIPDTKELCQEASDSAMQPKESSQLSPKVFLCAVDLDPSPLTAEQSGIQETKEFFQEVSDSAIQPKESSQRSPKAYLRAVDLDPSPTTGEQFGIQKTKELCQEASDSAMQPKESSQLSPKVFLCAVDLDPSPLTAEQSGIQETKEFFQEVSDSAIQPKESSQRSPKAYLCAVDLDPSPSNGEQSGIQETKELCQEASDSAMQPKESSQRSPKAYLCAVDLVLTNSTDEKSEMAQPTELKVKNCEPNSACVNVAMYLSPPDSTHSSASKVMKYSDLRIPTPKPNFITVASRVVWLLNLPVDCNCDELKEIMSAYGSVDSVMRCSKQSSALVTMSTRAEAANFVHNIGKDFLIKGKRVKVCYGKGKGVSKHDNKDHWDGCKGITVLPFDCLPTDLSGLAKEGHLDISSLPVAKRDSYNTDGTFKINPVCSSFEQNAIMHNFEWKLDRRTSSDEKPFIIVPDPEDLHI